MLVVQMEVEVFLTQRELVGRALEPALQVVLERDHRRRRSIRRGRDALSQPGPDSTPPRQPTLVDAQRRFHEYPHRLDQRGPSVVEQPRYGLKPTRQLDGSLLRGAVSPAQQEMQAPQQVREPEP